MGRTLPCHHIRGILFNPFGVSDNSKRSWREYLINKLQFRWMLLNKKMEHVYILNSDNLAKALNKQYRMQNLFISLPDPILIAPKIRQNKSIGNVPECTDKYRYLLFGSLSSRKGIFLVLEAIRKISEDIVERIEFLFAGRVTLDDRALFTAALADIKRNRPRVTIHYLDEFVPYEAIPELFSSSDCVLVPYVGNQSSSGVIGHAALYGKPVIGPDRGLVGDLIRSYNLGTVITTTDASQLSNIMEEYYRYGKFCCKTEGMQRFVEERHPSRFVGTLIAE